MEYLGDKLSVAQSQVSAWASNMRRSLQEALGLLSGAVERPEGQEAEETGSGFRRATSLRGLASRSRESLRNFSTRSQRHLSIRNLRKRLGNLDDDPPVSSDPPAAPGPQDSRALAGNGPREEEDDMRDKLISEEDDHYGSLDTTPHPGEDSPTPTASTPTDALPEPSTPSELPSPSATSSVPCEATDPLPFPETPTSLLDSSALRARVQLGKRRSQRAPPSRAARQRAALDAKDPQFQNSAGTRSEMTAQGDVEDEDEEDEEEEVKAEPCLTPLQPQRVALFPGVDPSALMAQLKKRVGDSENQAEQPPPQRSAKSPFLSQATRVLPPVTDKENRENSSPQWLQELKSKKRFSQHDSDT